MPEQLWYIRDCRLFEQLTEEQLARLERRARVRRFPANNPIYLPSDAASGVFLVAEGRVKLCSFTPDGKQSILAFIEPGELFGELSLLVPGPREEHAETTVKSTVVLLPGEELEQLLEESPALTLGVTKLIGLRRQRIERRLKSLLFHSNRDRLSHLLLSLAEQYGHRQAEGVALGIRLSHQELASIIGATREPVTVVLGQLQPEGLIRVARRKIVIRDLDRLAESVSAQPPRLAAELPTPSPGGPPRRQIPESRVAPAPDGGMR